ncbi:protocadherin Fat 4-like [Glandiceps talaboti]
MVTQLVNRRKVGIGLLDVILGVLIIGFNGQAGAQDCTISWGTIGGYDIKEYSTGGTTVIDASEVTVSYSGSASAGSPNVFELVSATPGPSTLFSVNVITGEVTIGATTPDFATHGPSQTVNVKCTTDTANDGTYAIQVNILQNEAPTFLNLPTTISISEDVAVSSTIYTVQYNDVEGDTIAIAIDSQLPTTPTFTNNNEFIVAPAGLDYDADPTKRSFTITISADDGHRASPPTAVLTVNLIDVADESPVFGAATYTGDIDENQSVGTAITWVTDPSGDYSDDDVSDYWTFTISGTNANDFFCDMTTGVITSAQILDVDGASPVTSYSLTLTITDSGGNTDTATLAITVNNINDNDPIWSPSSYTQTVAENTAAGTSIIATTVTDADSGTNGDLTVTIESGDDAAPNQKFAVTGTGPYVIQTSTVAIDYEDATLISNGHIYRLIVTAVDGGGTTSSATVAVTVTSVNEATPTFTSFPAAVVTMYENEGIGYEVASSTDIVADDTDEGPDGEITYSIDSVSPAAGTSKFYIEPLTARITTLDTFDYETDPTRYDITVKAEDGGTVPSSTTQVLTFDILDYNDNAPVFGQTIYNGISTEGDAVDSIVAALSVSDADSTATFTLSFVSGNGDDKFKIDNALQEIRIKNTIDLDVGTGDSQLYSLVVRVVDGGTPELSGTTTVHVDVTPSNDHDPVFAATTPVSITVQENSAVGTSVATINAADNDYGTQGDITFTIENGDTDNNFQLDPTTGLLEVKSNVDYESTGTPLTLKIKAADGGSPSRTATSDISITVTNLNDNEPSCTSLSYTANIGELSAVGTSVAQLTCTDADGDTLTYTLISTDFTVDATGLVEVAAGNSIDYESGTTSYSLTIDVSDGGTTLQALVGVSIDPEDDGGPTFAATPSLDGTFAEDRLLGSTITDASTAASDPDGNGLPHGIVSYTLSSVNPASGTDKFNIDSVSGVVTLMKELDYEDETSYELEIIVTDGVGSTDTATATISVTDVNDNDPSCTPTAFYLDENEHIYPYTAVSTTDLTCTDPDTGAGGTLAYSLISQSPAGEFDVSSTTGEVSLKADTMEFEGPNRQYDLTLQVADGGSPVRSITIDIIITVNPINDDGPSFLGPFSAAVSEDSVIGYSVETCAAIDPDSTDTGDGIVSYSITNGDPSSQFYIDPNTAVVTVRAPLDRETTDSYDLEITAVDAAALPLSATQTLSITITDVNDVIPYCTDMTFSEYLSEDTTTTTVLYSLVCADDDESDVLTYTITSGDTTTFMVNALGNIILQQVVDYDAGDRSFPLEITVEDAGSNSVIVQGTFIVEPINQHPPVFTPNTYTPSVGEDTVTGTTIETVLATDADSAVTSHGVVKYAFGAACSCPEFSIDQDSGDVILLELLDFEVTTSYNLPIEATDGDNTDTAMVTVTVTDVNDNSPVFTSTAYRGTVTEEMAAGESIFTVLANDDDSALNDNNVIEYTITAGDVSGFFEFVDPNIGEITTTGPIDYENDQSFTLTITAQDLNGAVGANSATTLVTVTIIAENEFDPVFQSTPYTATVSEDSILQTSVFQVAATDDDEPNHTHGQVWFSITTGNDAGHFTIDETTGEVFTMTKLDRETISSYQLTITAADSLLIPADERTASENITITVDDVNDNTPVFTPSAYSASVVEDESTGFVVVTLTTNDDDIGVNGQVGIVKTAGDASDDFVLSGNDVTIKNNLQHHIKNFYTITYTVTDRGVPPLSSEGTVTITVISVNEFAPAFSSPTDTVTISEDAEISDLVYTAVATDTDQGIHGQLVYFITAGDPGVTFLIDRNSGVITLSAHLDRETYASYVLEITVFDNGGDLLAVDTFNDTMELTVTVDDVNDNNPTFNPDQYTENIDENIPIGTSITTVMATDGDDGTNADVSYSITSGLGMEKFNINNITGEITTVDDIDYETDQMFSLMVAAVDGGTPQRTGLANVQVNVNDLNDNAPVISPSLFTVAIAEDTTADVLVTPIQVSDADSGVNGEVTCAIVPDTDPLGQFYVDPVTCDLYASSVGLDRETQDLFDLEINATDGGTPMLYDIGYVSVVITDINDNDPIIDPPSYSTAIDEDVPIGTIVVDIEATDEDIDENGELTYALTAGNELGHFDIDSDTGILTVAQNLDRETKGSYSMTVTVSDNGIPVRSSTAPVDITLNDVNDNAPDFTYDTYAFSVQENVPIGTSVDQISATDPDLGPNGLVTYSIESGANKDHFTINANTGEIFTAAAIDRETIARYVLVCKGTDAGTPSLYSEVDVIIDVGDENDNDPVFTEDPYEAAIDENSPAGTSVVTVTAFDADTGANGLVAYSIPASETDANIYFQIDSASGEITVKSPTDAETHPSFTFLVEGADNGSPSRSSTTTVIVTNNDLNDNYPIFDPSFYSAELSYLNDLGEPVVTVTATDADRDQTVTYFFIEATDLYELDSNTGNIRVIVDRQPDKNTKYTLYVEARDDGTPQRTSQTDATVRIDTFNPYDRLVEFYLSVSVDYFESTQDDFMAALDDIVQQDYPTGRMGISHVERREVGAGVATSRRLLATQDHEITVFLYGVQDDIADDINGLDRNKDFMTNTYLFNKFTADSTGTPSDALIRDPFTQWDVSQVLLHEDPNSIEWYQTWWGILLLVLLSLVLLCLILLAIFVIYRKCFRENKKQPVKPAARETRARQGWGSNSAYKAKAANPTSNIVMLPVSRPVTTEKRPPPRKPAPRPTTNYAKKPQTKPDDRNPQRDNNSELQSLKEEQHYDGRSQDPETGRLYEYNTKTGKRRWLTTDNYNVSVPGNVGS